MTKSAKTLKMLTITLMVTIFIVTLTETVNAKAINNNKSLHEQCYDSENNGKKYNMYADKIGNEKLFQEKVNEEMLDSRLEIHKPIQKVTQENMSEEAVWLMVIFALGMGLLSLTAILLTATYISIMKSPENVQSKPDETYLKLK